MHVVEHIGLGRYGDPLDPKGDLRAFEELRRVLKPGGALLLVVPVGAPVIRFNAHRIYSLEQITTNFFDSDLVEFSLISDEATSHGLIRHAAPHLVQIQKYGCGCFYFVKRP